MVFGALARATPVCQESCAAGEAADWTPITSVPGRDGGRDEAGRCGAGPAADGHDEHVEGGRLLEQLEVQGADARR